MCTNPSSAPARAARARELAKKLCCPKGVFHEAGLLPSPLAFSHVCERASSALALLAGPRLGPEPLLSTVSTRALAPLPTLWPRASSFGNASWSLCAFLHPARALQLQRRLARARVAMSSSSSPSLFEALLARQGAATTAINWCEEDHAVTPHVAEFYNALSSLAFVVAGVSMYMTSLRLRLPPALLAAGPLTVLTGLASAAFHATLTLEGQRVDELFETLSLVALLHGAQASARALVHAAAAAAGVLFVSAFLFTEVHLISVAVATGAQLAGLAQRLPSVSARVRAAAGAGLAGAACWLADRLLCSFLSDALPINPQLHAWWHVLGAVCLHEALACLGAAHAIASGAKPQPWMLAPLGSVCSR